MRQLHWDGVELSGMIELAQKYCLETGEFPKRLVQALGRPSRWCKPEDLYLVGVKYRMQELCTFAAKCSTNLDLYPRSIVPFPTSEVEALSLSPVLPQAIIAWGKFQEAARKSVSMLVNAIQKESRWIACKGLPFDITFESREDFELSGHSDACIRTFEGSQGSSIWTLAGELDPENPSEDDLYAKKITAPRWFRQLLDEIALKYSAYPHREAFADHPIISNAVARVGKCPMCGEDPALLALEIRDWCTKFADDVDNFMEFILSDSYSYSYTWNNCDASLRRWKEEFSLVSQLQFH
ncbi:hypothetical protein GYMLUDRAFT_101285 [Collybiopsis luxurians FD-317 M1]|uniref:Uncharacterized protein n=1 Tax=Collybiopsis luxurians FD-317 M1 TaxID=944289 RepID=A0A0D0BYI5_9AGAR|nr:hypothetical protein GYMLUDRAFT_101285 [Collybiopsis luxurians FD-317 M1]